MADEANFDDLFDFEGYSAEDPVRPESVCGADPLPLDR